MIKIDENKHYTRQEIADLFNYSLSSISSKWYRTKQSLLNKGYDVSKIEEKRGIVYYTIKKVVPNREKYWIEDLPGEEWITTYCHPDFEVSNKGRVREKNTYKLHKASDDGDGYLSVSIKNKSYRLHLLVLRSFSPIPDWDKFTIDHIDGNRKNANLDNLRYLSPQKNTLTMLFNRDDLQMAITEKLKQGYSYQDLLNVINSLPKKQKKFF